MVAQEISVGTSAQIDVTMSESAVGLDEVVVVGYGTQKKINVIGSVTTISSKEITTAPISNISNALAGRHSGAVIQLGGGEPGNDAASILVRGTATLGNNSPLIVVDGIPGRDLNSINPSDIENISVLKDASAAIYGAAAANGVILVTTKRGKEGEPLTVSYGFYDGLSSPTKLPKLADAPTYAQMIRELQSYEGVDPSQMMFSADDVEKFKSGKYPWTYPNTDWYGAVMKKSTQTRNHNLSLRGSKGAINYYTSFSTQYNEGIFKNGSTEFRRYNIKSTIDAKVNEYLSLGLDVNFSQENKTYPSVSSGSNFDALQRQFPKTAAIYPNGLAGPDNIGYGFNPVVTATDQTGFDESKNYYLNNIFSANLKIPGIKGLVVSSYYAYDIINGTQKIFQKPWTLYALDTQAYLAAGNTGAEDGSAFLIGSKRGPADIWLRDFNNNTTTKTFNFKVDYTTTINSVHNISAFFAYENSEYEYNQVMAYRRNLISYQLPYLFAGGQAQKDNGETVAIDARVNYFGRISYNYKEKYLFQFSLRRDGSLRFSEQSGRWGNFPGVLAGWNISKEDFWKNNVKFINFFKLKASCGKLGNDRVEPFQYLSSYSISNGWVTGARMYNVGLAQVGATNTNITWEVANIYNAGFESLFLNSKMTLNADFFNERRTNILVKRKASVPQFTGITLPDENYGIVDSKGLEIVMGYADDGKDFSYSVNGNFAFARNKVVEFDELAKSVEWQVLIGHPQGSTLLYRAIGIFKDEAQINSTPHVAGARPGDIILEDYNKDGEITADDRTLLFQTAIPEITFGLSFNVSYKNWSLNGLFQGVGNMTKQIYTDYIGLSGNYLAYDGTAQSDLVGYLSPDRTALWMAAKNAAKAVMDMHTVGLENFRAPDQAAVATNFFNFVKAIDLASNEVIWGKMFMKDVGAFNQMNLINGTNGFVMYGCNAPTGNLADSFQMADGSKFLDHFMVDADGFYKNISTKYHHENMFYDREPRFYATILYDSVPWIKRLADLAARDPLGIYDKRTRITISGGVEVSKIYGIDTRQGPIDKEDGTFTGYVFKKYEDDKLIGSDLNNNENAWIEMRYAEIVLNYAEACLELGEVGEATDYINLIRNRAGLPNFTGDIKEALRYERQMEFVFENIRWYDIRRWKILDKALTKASGVDIIETNNLDLGTRTTTWRQIFVQNRGPISDKMLWFPIPIDEMNRAPQLIQNPGY